MVIYTNGETKINFLIVFYVYDVTEEQDAFCDFIPKCSYKM